MNPKLPTARHAIIGAASLALVAVCAPGALGRSPDHTAGVAPPALAARIDARQVPTSERLPASSSTFTYLSNELADVSAAKLRLRDISASRDSLQALTEPTVRYPGATGKASAPALTGSTGSTLARGLPFPSDGRIDQSGAFGLVGVWDGFPYTGWVPASPQVAAGPRQLVATVNSRLRVFNKDGALESSHSLRSWFAPVLEPMGIGGFFVTSPWVVYDEREARFVITAVANRADGLSYILLAVSHDDLATGDWCVYGTDAVLDGADRGVHYAANPRAEVNIDAVVVTANMFSMFDGRFGHAKARLFPKSTIYERSCSGGAAWADIWGLRDELGEAVRDLRPVRTDSDEHVARFVNAHLLGGDSLTLWSLNSDLDLQAPSTHPDAPSRTTVGVPHFSLGADGKQPGTATRVSTGSASLHTAVHRGRSMWTSHTVGCTWPGDHEVRACTRWYEIDLDSGRALQDGTFGQPGNYVFHAETMPDEDGNASFVFNRVGELLKLESDYVCRRSFDAPSSTTGQIVQLVTGQGCYVRLGNDAYNQWGLHNGIARDPVTKRNWIHSAYAFGDSADCTANTWRTLLADLSCAPIAGPTPTSPSDPPPTAVPTMQPLEPVAGAPTPRPTLAPPCRAAVDVMLVLDSSGSIGGSDYEIVRAFARAFAGGISLGPDGARLGIVQFSSESQTRLEIGLGHDSTAIANAISRMQYLAGTTDMDGGLQLGLDELRANGRASVPKVIVLMSDGQPNQGDPQPVADAAKAEGVRVLTIGVGNGIDVGLMRSLASPPASQTFFYAEEFDALMELVDRLVVSTCPTPGTPTPEPTPTRDARLTHTKYFPIALKDPECPPEKDFVDVMLVLDASTSMLERTPDGRRLYEVALEAAVGFSRGFRLEPGGDRLGVVAFNSSGLLLQHLTHDAPRLEAVLRAFTPVRQQSRLELGVSLAADELAATQGAEHRRTAMVILTDGLTNPRPGSESVQAAEAAKKQGVLVYVVGMGVSMDRGVLVPMASGQGRFHPAEQAADLAPVFHELAGEVACPPELFWHSRRP